MSARRQSRESDAAAARTDQKVIRESRRLAQVEQDDVVGLLVLGRDRSLNSDGIREGLRRFSVLAMQPACPLYARRRLGRTVTLRKEVRSVLLHAGGTIPRSARGVPRAADRQSDTSASTRSKITRSMHRSHITAGLECCLATRRVRGIRVRPSACISAAPATPGSPTGTPGRETTAKCAQVRGPPGSSSTSRSRETHRRRSRKTVPAH